jgi:hypothetical protein
MFVTLSAGMLILHNDGTTFFTPWFHLLLVGGCVREKSQTVNTKTKLGYVQQIFPFDIAF